MKVRGLPLRIDAERLYLRSYTAGDGPLLFEISQKNRKHLARYESENFLLAISSRDQAEKHAKDLEQAFLDGECYFLPVFLKTSDEFVAQIYVGPTRKDLPEYVIGFIADVDYEGLGYVTEALKATLYSIYKDLNAHRIFLECDETNQRSWRVAERCGFIREGHLRENKRNADNSLSGTYVYSLLRSDFERLKDK